MFIEQFSIEKLQKLVYKRGLFSKEARIICREIEFAKRQYEHLIHSQSQIPEQNIEAQSIVKYYLFQLEKLKYELPYDVMGDQFTIPLFLLSEFQKEDILERIEQSAMRGQSLNREQLECELRKFITVQLDLRGIVLYMDILEGINSEGKHCVGHSKIL